jgi:hypothetical protein
VRVGEEALRVGYNLLDVEAISLVLLGCWVDNANGEGSLEAAIRSAALIWAGGVGEGLGRVLVNVLIMWSWMEEGATYKSGWSSFALDSLVNMRRSKRSGLVLSSHTAESDVVADGVLSNVDAVLEEALGTGLTGSRGAGGCDDLVGSGLDDVFSVEVEELLVLLPAVVLSVPFGVPVLLAVGFVVVLAARGGGEGKGS